MVTSGTVGQRGRYNHGNDGGICQLRGGSSLYKDGLGCSRHRLGFDSDWVGCRRNRRAGEEAGGGTGACQGVG